MIGGKKYVPWLPELHSCVLARLHIPGGLKMLKVGSVISNQRTPSPAGCFACPPRS